MAAMGWAYKRGTDTVIIALDGTTGTTVWEQAFDAKPVKEEMDPVMESFIVA